MEKLVHSETKTLYNEGLRDALKGIYEVYGSDLSAFFRDASEKGIPDEPRPKHRSKQASTRQSARRKVS